MKNKNNLPKKFLRWLRKNFPNILCCIDILINIIVIFVKSGST